MLKDKKFSEKEMAFISKAEQYCAAGEQCRSAVRDKLMTWGADKETTHRITEYLVENDFINEERYCRLYCDSKIRLQKWGRVKIVYQLRGKRIDSQIVDKAIQGIDEEQYFETLRTLAANKARSITETDPRKKRSKLSSFLSSHGFTVAEIASVVNDIVADASPED